MKLSLSGTGNRQTGECGKDGGQKRRTEEEGWGRVTEESNTFYVFF